MTKLAEKFAKFKEWIAARGGEVLVPTSEWEVVRFRGAGVTSIIFTKKNGSLSFAGDARRAWDEFESRSDFRFAPRSPRRGRAPVVVRTLLDRDGPLCFYCGVEFTEEVAPTKEHLVARTAGGPDHVSNLFLSCQPCNHEVGHKSAAEKIRFRDRKRRGAGTTLLVDLRPHVHAFAGDVPELQNLLARLDAIIHHQPKKEKTDA